MKKCPQCERSLPDDAKQCIFCGEHLDSGLDSPSPASQPAVKSESVVYQQPTQTAASHPAPQRPRGSSNTLLYSIIALLVAMLIGGAIAWFVTRDKNNEAPVEQTPATEQTSSQQQSAVDMPPAEEPQQTRSQQSIPPSEGINADSNTDAADTDCYIGKVVVTGTDVRLRSTPQINNHNILKDRRGKNLHPRKGEVLPCIDMAGDFFYVDFHGVPCYISSQFTRFME